MAPDRLGLETIAVGDLQTNAYLLYSAATRACLIIDPGAEPDTIRRAVARLNLQPAGIILTHGHYDHIGAVAELKERYHIPLWLYELEQQMLDSALNKEMGRSYGFTQPPPADRLVHDGDTIQVSDISLTVVHTPGHTPGSMTLHADDWLFTGDTLFNGDIGRTDLPGGDDAAMKRSLEKLMAFADDLQIFPGHGEPSTIGAERQYNPYL